MTHPPTFFMTLDDQSVRALGGMAAIGVPVRPLWAGLPAPGLSRRKRTQKGRAR